MTTRTYHMFGNPDIATDSLPLQLIPQLQATFPQYDFIPLDPNEEWAIPETFRVIDTIVGIEEVRMFTSLEHFEASPSVSMHDFDALFNLRYLAKLGKLHRVHIIGIPPQYSPVQALDEVSAIIRAESLDISDPTTAAQAS